MIPALPLEERFRGTLDGVWSSQPGARGAGSGPGRRVDDCFEQIVLREIGRGVALEDDRVRVMFVPLDVYEKSKVGDRLTVVNTPFNTTAPELVSDVKAFDAGIYYPRIVIALLLMIGLWFVGRRISKAAARS